MKDNEEEVNETQFRINDDEDVEIFIGGPKLDYHVFERLGRMDPDLQFNKFAYTNAKGQPKSSNKYFGDNGRKYFTMTNGNYRLHTGVHISDPEEYAGRPLETLNSYDRKVVEKGEVVVDYHNETFDDISAVAKIKW